MQLIQHQTQIEQSTLNSRQMFFASKHLTLFGSEAAPLVDAFLIPYRSISTHIQGTVANPGWVKGKARVLVPDFKNFDSITIAVQEMQQGEILVAETTAPEIIAACKKASAIITNQGGILSHAAIVSRELNIPCIVGTDKDVTLNIKTGDELEIDAHQGIIHILDKQ